MARLPKGARKREDGTYEKRFTVDGKRYSIYGGTVKELEQKEFDLRKKIESRTYTPNKKVTLNDYFYNDWLPHKVATIKESTWRNYEIYYRCQLKDKIGDVKMQSLEPRMIKRAMDEVAKELKPDSYNNLVKILSGVMKEAVSDRVIAENPAKGIKALKVAKKAIDTTHRALTVTEQKQFMTALRGDYHYEFLAFMLSTGMRQGEVAALSWSDIDYKNDVIHVTKTITRAKEGCMVVGDTPKTSAGVRDIDMNEGIKSVLAMQRAKVWGNVVPNGNQLVFPSLFGNITHNNSLNRSIKTTLAKLEEEGIVIEPFTSHALRDTFATRFLEAGGQPKTLQKLLGHENISVTMNIYAHCMADTKREEMNRIQIAI